MDPSRGRAAVMLPGEWRALVDALLVAAGLADGLRTVVVSGGVVTLVVQDRGVRVTDDWLDALDRLREGVGDLNAALVKMRAMVGA